MAKTDYKSKCDRIIKATKNGCIIHNELEKTIIEKQQRGDRLTAGDMITIEEIMDRLEVKR